MQVTSPLGAADLDPKSAVGGSTVTTIEVSDEGFGAQQGADIPRPRGGATALQQVQSEATAFQYLLNRRLVATSALANAAML